MGWGVDDYPQPDETVSDDFDNFDESLLDEIKQTVKKDIDMENTQKAIHVMQQVNQTLGLIDVSISELQGAAKNRDWLTFDRYLNDLEALTQNVEFLTGELLKDLDNGKGPYGL